MTNKHKILFGLVLMVMVFTLAIPAFAQTQYKLIEPLPGIQETTGFGDYVERIIPFLLAFAALAAFVQIVFGGILRATSGGNPSAIGDANDRIWQAILGLVLALSAWLILNTINPDLVSLRFLVPKIEIAPTQSGGGVESLTPEEKLMLGKRSYTKSGCESECKSPKLKCALTPQSLGLYECLLIQTTK